MARRTKEEAQETRSRILDTAEHVFFDKGVSHTSLTDIAEAAGVTRGAIYWHFKNKGDLFDAMFARIKLPMDEVIGSSIDVREPDPLGRMRELVMECLAGTVANEQRARVLNILFFKCEFTDEMGAVLARHKDAIQEGREKIAAGLQNAIDKGQLPIDLDTGRAAIMLHAFMGGMLSDWMLNPERVDLREGAERYVDALFDMIRHAGSLRRTPPSSHPGSESGSEALPGPGA
jgi:TetR/AcrR family transcriptional regulator, acrAB operon repressor